MIPIPACFFSWKFRGQVHEPPGHQQEIQADRDRKLEAARKQQKNRRQQAA
jgi:hypothetical protein